MFQSFYHYITVSAESVPIFRLTHCILVDSSTVICWMSPFDILEVLDLFVAFILILMENPVSNVDPDQMPHHVASDPGLHCLPMTLLQFSR